MALFWSPHDQISGDEPRSLAGLVMASRRLSLLVLTRCSLTVGIPRSDVCEGIGVRVDWNFNLEIWLRYVEMTF